MYKNTEAGRKARARAEELCEMERKVKRDVEFIKNGDPKKVDAWLKSFTGHRYSWER